MDIREKVQIRRAKARQTVASAVSNVRASVAGKTDLSYAEAAAELNSAKDDLTSAEAAAIAVSRFPPL